VTHLLDSNSCLDHLRNGPASKVTAKLSAAQPGSIALCSVVVAELIYGAYRSSQPGRNLQEVSVFCGIPFTSVRRLGSRGIRPDSGAPDHLSARMIF
jgi:hypothetical protein